MKHKSAPVQLAPDPEEGTFEAIVSVFGNKDYAGDIVMPGAFAKSLELWKSVGDPMPVYWSHRLDDPTYNVGEVTEAREFFAGDPAIPDWVNEHVKNNGGLYIKGVIDDFGLGTQVRHLLKTRRVRQWSYTYDVIRETKSKDNQANELHEVFLHEVGPTPLGANPLTELISAKNRPPDPGVNEAKARLAGLFSCVQRAELGDWLKLDH